MCIRHFVLSRVVWIDFCKNDANNGRGVKMKANPEIEILKQSNLSAATIKVRDAVIQKCEGKDLDEMNLFIKQLLGHETNEQKRIGVLAARVYLLREKIAFLLGNEFDDDSADHIKSRHGANAGGPSNVEISSSEDDPEEEQASITQNEWMRVRILKDAEVNNVRFPAGIVIDARLEDAQKLVDAGKAESIVGSEDSQKSDEDAAAAEEETQESKVEDAEAGDEEAADDDEGKS
jgi:hypothetical protein